MCNVAIFALKDHSFISELVGYSKKQSNKKKEQTMKALMFFNFNCSGSENVKNVIFALVFVLVLQSRWNYARYNFG